MFCTKCGRQMQDGSKFCTGCGSRLDAPPIQGQNQPVPSNQMTGRQIHQQGQNQAIPPSQMPGRQTSRQGQGQPVPPNIPGGQGYPGNQMYTPPQPDVRPLGPEDFHVRPPEEKKSRTALIVIIIVTVAVLVIAGVALFFFLGRDSGSGGSGRDKDHSRSSDRAEIDEDEDEDDDEDGHTVTAQMTVVLTKATTAKVTTVATTTEALDNYDSISRYASGKKPIGVNYVSADVSDYPNVKVYFTAEDELGETVYLSSPNVAVREKITGGKELEQTVKSIGQLEGREGISISLVADKSGSMDSDLPTMQNIMTDFVSVLDYKLGDRAELIAFDSYVMYMCTYTDDPILLKNGIANMSPYGMTALYDALYSAVTDAGMQKGARCVIAFTDGLENESTHTAKDVIDLANDLSVPIFIIGTVGANADYENIAFSTGGDYWDIGSISNMQSVLDQIYAGEKDMYCLEYTSDSNADPLSERTLSIAVSDETYGSVTEMIFTPTEEKKTEKHNSRYELIKGDISWEEANAECIKRGGHLITITSEEELKTAADLADKAGLKYVWMGGYTSVRGSSVYGHWITGEDFAYQKWYPGEPSRNDLDGTPEMYLMLWNVNNEGWTWNDQRDDLFTKELAHIFTGKTGYICEYEE